jgi:hypothetical protein
MESMRRGLTSMLLAGVIAGALLPSTAAADVSATNPTDFTVPTMGSAAPYPSTIFLSGLIGQVTKVTVSVGTGDGPQPGDLDVLLEAPNNANVMLFSDACNMPTAAGTVFTIDDSAPTAIPDACPPASATYRPTNAIDDDPMILPAPPPPHGFNLGSLIGTPPNGFWDLYIVDDSAVAGGTEIAGGWTLNLFGVSPAVAAPPAQTTATPAPAATKNCKKIKNRKKRKKCKRSQRAG